MGTPSHAEFSVNPQWQQTGDAYFPVAARVDKQWWVLRVNAFPDHPLWTFFVSGKRRFDLDDAPPACGRPADPEMPALDEVQARDALAAVAGFAAYGSEVGRPCDNLFCCG